MDYCVLFHYSLAGELSLCFQLFATANNAVKEILVLMPSVPMALLLWKRFPGVKVLEQCMYFKF